MNEGDKMFSKPILHKFLARTDYIDDLYKSMLDPDPCAPVITLLNILKETKDIPENLKEDKCEVKSTTYRNRGMSAWKLKQYHNALIAYNKALLYAPENSMSMKLAYSSRSSLLYKMRSYSACLNDIETIFKLGCPADLEEKLENRKNKINRLLWMERLIYCCKFTIFAEEFFQLNIKRNPQISCASNIVGVVMESQVPKIVAMNNVKVGTVLAVETAFVSESNKDNMEFSCHYCHKMSLNLIPCDGCCTALFCNYDCKELCMEEYHSVECQLMETLEAMLPDTQARLAMKGFLKMKSMSNSWNSIITASKTTGIDRIKDSTINEIYNSNSTFSLLSRRDERNILNGPMYNASFNSALVIYYLDTICNIFPSEPTEKMEAIKATARIMMYLSLFATPIRMIAGMTVTRHMKLDIHDIPNFGLYSFIGKLENSCNPNVLAIGLNKKLALVALQPIQRGTELTISFIGHWLDSVTMKQPRHKNMFKMFGCVCNCFLCSNDDVPRKCILTETQSESFKTLNLDYMRTNFNPRTVPKMFPKLCKTLTDLNNIPFSEEYTTVYTLFRKCILYLQENRTSNIILDHL